MIRINKIKTMLVIMAVLTITISTVSYTLSILAKANEQVTQNITDFSRGSYDILIRPPHAKTDLERQLNLVEENYLGIGDGGISMEEWQEIKNHPQVEIAAPVASIGLFTAQERTFMMDRNPEDATYYEVEYRTSDGVNTYASDKEYIYDFGNKGIDSPKYPTSIDLLNNYLGNDVAVFSFPKSYHQVVAIDPEEEGKLTGFDFTPLTEEPYHTNSYKESRYSTPVMSLQDVSVPVTVQFTMDGLKDITSEELEVLEQKFIAGQPIATLAEDPTLYFHILDQHIHTKKMLKEESYELVPNAGHSPFLSHRLKINDNMTTFRLIEGIDDLEEDEGYAETYDVHSQRIGYLLEPVIYEIKEDNTLFVKQTGVDNVYKVPTYRNLEEVELYKLNKDRLYEAENDEEYFGLIENGTFSIKENTESLASAPLGIYGREMPYLASDESIKLQPTAVPGSFITTPAHGLIAIEEAERVKSDAPIDAIRVKVAGLTGYDKKAEKLIEELANEWREQGFTVDIVAGASLQDLTVDVEGIGQVVQSFTTLGAAGTVVSSWNMMQVVLTVLYGLVALTFVGYTYFIVLADRKNDEQLLAHLGWSEKLIRSIRYKEFSFVLGIPIVLVSIGFISLGIWNDQWLPFIISIIVSGVNVLLFLIADKMKKDKVRLIKKQAKSVTIQNIRFYRNNLLASSIQLFFMAILTCFLPFFLIQNVERTTKTRLGSFIHGEIEGIFFLVIILLYVLSLTTVFQSLNRMWNARKSEIQLFQILGWGKKAIQGYFQKEVLIWAGLSTLVGWITSLIITILVTEITMMTVLLGFVGFLIILAATIIGSTISLYRVNVRRGGKIANRAS
ncbi:hypothetical protein [Ornithinibacillus sp. JPR2-1]|uniref:hypothetical protein n=1 Tax=Ornithinibacillus sp. JPR2-1 TaxID=2094019 RepID=UPI0031DF087A